MAEFNEENKVEGVFGGVNFEEASNVQVAEVSDGTVFRKVEASELPTKPSVWSKIRSFLFQEIDLNAPIKVELTPYQQKVEDEVNEFLHQDVGKLLFKKIKF
jgi:hypothetical protein